MKNFLERLELIITIFTLIVISVLIIIIFYFNAISIIK